MRQFKLVLFFLLITVFVSISVSNSYAFGHVYKNEVVSTFLGMLDGIQHDKAVEIGARSTGIKEFIAAVYDRPILDKGNGKWGIKGWSDICGDKDRGGMNCIFNVDVDRKLFAAYCEANKGVLYSWQRAENTGYPFLVCEVGGKVHSFQSHYYDLSPYSRGQTQSFYYHHFDYGDGGAFEKLYRPIYTSADKSVIYSQGRGTLHAKLELRNTFKKAITLDLKTVKIMVGENEYDTECGNYSLSRKGTTCFGREIPIVKLNPGEKFSGAEDLRISGLSEIPDGVPVTFIIGPIKVDQFAKRSHYEVTKTRSIKPRIAK